MEIRKICQWCGKPFIAQKTTTCYCSHQCSNLGYKERIRERKRQLKRSQELLYNRGIQMYRFPNSDVQKSVIFEGIKKRLKIV